MQLSIKYVICFKQNEVKLMHSRVLLKTSEEENGSKKMFVVDNYYSLINLTIKTSLRSILKLLLYKNKFYRVSIRGLV